MYVPIALVKAQYFALPLTGKYFTSDFLISFSEKITLIYAW